MRVIFIIILLIHGIIHLFGFLKAFQIAELKELTQVVSKPFGILWLLAFILLAVAAGYLWFNNDKWWILGLAGVIVSQVLIIIFWQDARFGTGPNVVVLIICLLAMANSLFKKQVHNEVSQMLSFSPGKSALVSSDIIDDMPLPVQRWLRYSGVLNQEMTRNVYLRQKAKMKMKPEQKDWKEAQAVQFYTTDPPAFNWTVKLKMNPFMSIRGRDKFEDGEGEMLIKLLSLLPIVDVKDNKKINQGALQRYLGEIAWFPLAALSPYISWEEIGDHSVRATLTYGKTTGSGIFHFSEKGELQKFTAMRYYESDDDSDLYEWVIEVMENRAINGFNLPVDMQATWKLKEGDWTWLKLQLTDIQYNIDPHPEMISNLLTL